MKKILLFLFTSVLTFNTLHAQSTWINYSVDSRISVKVPFQPRKADKYSVIATTIDSIIFVIRKVEMKQAAGLDSAALANLTGTSQFADGIKNEMMTNMKGYLFGDMRQDKWHGYHSYAINADNPTSKTINYTFMFIMGDYLYSFIVISRETKDPKWKEYFFHSIRLH
jgi:hypothetical protein